MNNIDIKKPIEDYDTNYFDQSYLDVYKKILVDGLQEQIDFLTSIIDPDTESNILDFFCCNGRHILQLSDMGFHTTGLDINQQYLELIQQRSQGKVQTILADGREYVGQENFDVVLNLENSIGYIEDYEDNLKIIQSIHSCLRSGGKFILTLINRDYLVRNFHSLAWFGNGEGKYMLEKRRFDPTTSVLHIEEKRLTVDGSEKNYRLNMRLFSATEINLMLSSSGFKVLDIFGDFDRSPYRMNSPQMLYICEKI